MWVRSGMLKNNKAQIRRLKARMLGAMTKRSLNYPRYQPNPPRPPGTGAFFDFAAFVANRNAPKLKSCSLRRPWGNAARDAPAPEGVYLDAFDVVRR